MIRRIIIIQFLLAFIVNVKAQQTQPPPKDGWKNTRKGNESFAKKDFATAEKYYREGTEKDTSQAVASYNLGNSLYRQKKFSDAEKAYANATEGNNKDSLSRTWHNLGNAMLEQKKYQESINAYKQALKANPNDEETRYNLAYAQSKLKAQQPPPKQNQKNNQKNQQQQQQQQKQQQQKQQQQKQQQQKQQPQQQEPDQSMDKEEAQRMLDMLKDNEKKIRERMHNKKNKNGYNRSKEKDW